jgi:hypothetical protein
VLSGNGSYIGVAVLEAIKSIVMSWTTYMESAKELQMSYDSLMSLLGNNEYMKYFDESFPKDVVTFVTTKVWIRRSKLAHYEFMRTRSFRTKTSNSSEIEGGVLKHHVAGPKPNHSMAKAADSTCKVSDMRIVLKEQRAAKAMDSMPTNLEEELLPLYESVSLYCSNKIAGNWRHGLSKTVFRAEPNVFWVKPKAFSSFSSDPGMLAKYLSVRCERTRIVEIFQCQGRFYLKCSCCGYEQDGFICGCICAVVNEAPKPHDVIIRWHKSYDATYLNGNPSLDKVFDTLIENENPGPMLPACSVEMFRTDLPVGQCTTRHSREYFESTLPSKPPKPHPGVIWAKVGPYASTSVNDGPSSMDNEVNEMTTGIQMRVTLSQAATEQNEAYMKFSQQQDNDFSFPMNDEDGEDTLNPMDESMDTYMAKSPERQYSTLLHASTSPIQSKKISAMSATKPKYEALCNAIGTDEDLTRELNDALSELHVKAMMKHRKPNSRNGSGASGMQSYPAMDNSRRSVRVESCPTGNSAAGKAKKRAAKKPPPTASV